MKVKEKSDLLISNIKKVIVGNDKVVELVIAGLLSEGHILLEDMPGTGKTTMARALAASISAEFGRIQFTPDLLPQDVTGLNMFNQKTTEFQFRKGPVFANVILADEINRATPRTQSALLECMQERQVTVDGDTRKLEAPFFIIATQNPVETAGTYPLPEAQMDRFVMRLSLGYPEYDDELEIMNRFISDNPLEKIEAVISKDDVVEMQSAVKKIFVHDCVKQFIAGIVKATREEERLMCGVNPRGTLALLRCSQALAAMRGREYVMPDDIKELVIPVFMHRLFSHTRSQNKVVSTVLTDILNEVPVPTEDWTK